MLFSTVWVLFLTRCSHPPEGERRPPASTNARNLSEGAPVANAAQAAGAAARGPALFLPGPIDGFEPVAGPHYYDAENLFDLIDGGAEIYIAFGLKEMAVVRYRSAVRKAVEVAAEIYDMGTVEGAFGRMARFLFGRTEIRDAGQGLPGAIAGTGVFDGSDAVFSRGRYMVHLSVSDESPEATPGSITSAGRDILPRFAGRIAERIGEVASVPELFGAFPAEGRVPRGEAWEPSGVAGVEALGPGYTVRYEADGRAWTLFAARASGNDAGVEKGIAGISDGKEPDSRPIFGKAGEWVIGFVPEAGRWKGKDGRLPEAQLGALKSALEARPWR